MLAQIWLVCSLILVTVASSLTCGRQNHGHDNINSQVLVSLSWQWWRHLLSTFQNRPRVFIHDNVTAVGRNNNKYSLFTLAWSIIEVFWKYYARLPMLLLHSSRWHCHISTLMNRTSQSRKDSSSPGVAFNVHNSGCWGSNPWSEAENGTSRNCAARVMNNVECSTKLCFDQDFA